MRFGVVSLVIICLFGPTSYHVVAQSSGKKALHSFLALKKGAKRTNTFSADAPAICAFWESEGLEIGDTVGAVWIAENIGLADPNGTEIRRSNYRIFKKEEVGEFSLSRPAGKTWPVGRYRVELYINGAIADIMKFTVAPGVTIETH